MIAVFTGKESHLTGPTPWGQLLDGNKAGNTPAKPSRYFSPAYLPGRHEYPIGRVDPPDRLLSVFLKGVAIFTNLLLHSLKWDRTSTRLLRVSFYPELAKTSIAFFHYNIKRKNAKAICIPSINAWALDLKGVSVNTG